MKKYLKFIFFICFVFNFEIKLKLNKILKKVLDLYSNSCLLLLFSNDSSVKSSFVSIIIVEYEEIGGTVGCQLPVLSIAEDLDTNGIDGKVNEVFDCPTNNCSIIGMFCKPLISPEPEERLL